MQEEYNWTWNGQKKIPTYDPILFLAVRNIWQLNDTQRESYQRIALNCKNIYTCVYIICVYVFTHIYTSRRQTSSEKKICHVQRDLNRWPKMSFPVILAGD